VKNTTTAEQFCHDILKSDIKRAKAFVNIIMALGSETTAQNPTQLSESPFFQYHYSIICKVMKDIGLQLNSTESYNFKSGLRAILFEYLPKQEAYKLSSDFTTIRKPESPTLAERGFVHIPNTRIYGNQPIDIGYYVSCVNLGLYDDQHPEYWSLPLDNQRVEVNADKIAVAVQQLKDLLQDIYLPFGKSDKVVNMADSGYAVPAYVCPLIESFDNLLLIIRLRYGIKVYKAYQGEQSAKGRDKVYEDDPYYLQHQTSRLVYNPKTKTKFKKDQRPIFELACDEEDSYETQTARGRKLIVELCRWNDVLLRGSKDFKMDDKPFDLVCIRFIDKESGACLFQNEMFIAVWGKNRRKHMTIEAQKDYQHRYDIEPHNRFSKQQLMADKYQTPDVQHLEGWLWTVQITYWLLYAACCETEVCVKPWEKYLPQVKRAKESDAPHSVAMTRKGAKRLFSTFDLTHFKPKESNNGKGRIKNTTFPKRESHPPTRKTQNKQNCKQKIEQLE
jgi:hypothetical protein